MSKFKKNKNTFKMIVLGSYSVGKTSLVDRIVYKEFKCNETTIGASFNNINHDDKYNLNIWDTAGQERYRSISRIYFKDVHIVLMVYNMNNIDTLIDIESYWINDFYKSHYLNENKKCIFYVVGNLADSYYHENNIPIDITLNNSRKKILDKIARDYPQVKFFEVSAKSGYGIQHLEDNIFEDVDAINSNPQQVESEEDYFLDDDSRKLVRRCC